jgi:hypothetical protein
MDGLNFRVKGNWTTMASKLITKYSRDHGNVEPWVSAAIYDTMAKERSARKSPNGYNQ